MNPDEDAPEDDGGGFDVDDWSRLKPFNGAVATLDDVQAAPIDEPLPIGQMTPIWVALNPPDSEVVSDWRSFTAPVTIEFEFGSVRIAMPISRREA